MKPRGRHPEKALTAVHIRNAKKPGRYADGNGLYLVVDPTGAKRWVLRTVVQGGRRDIGLGGVTLVPLAEAREKALAMRKVAREGGDPLADRRRAAEVVPTFAEAAEQVHAARAPGWRNSKHAAQWTSTLQTYVFPFFGDRRVDQITTADVLKALSPIWLSKPETARRVRQRIGVVLDWTKAAGHRSGDNPILGVSNGLPKQGERDKHHKALPYGTVPQFIEQMRASNANVITKLAFEFLVLTASRTSEVLKARWDEMDEFERLWTVPAERMKAKRLHRVPMSDRCMEIIEEAKPLAMGSEFIFPSQKLDKPLSNMVFSAVLKRLEVDATAHGFRSSFRDWAAEQTSFPREVCEAALAHTVENKVEAAYRRGDLLEKRRELMQAWSSYAEKIPQDMVQDSK